MLQIGSTSALALIPPATARIWGVLKASLAGGALGTLATAKALPTSAMLVRYVKLVCRPLRSTGILAGFCEVLFI